MLPGRNYSSPRVWLLILEFQTNLNFKFGMRSLSSLAHCCAIPVCLTGIKWVFNTLSISNPLPFVSNPRWNPNYWKLATRISYFCWRVYFKTPQRGSSFDEVWGNHTRLGSMRSELVVLWRELSFPPAKRHNPYSLEYHPLEAMVSFVEHPGQAIPVTAAKLLPKTWGSFCSSKRLLF